MEFDSLSYYIMLLTDCLPYELPIIYSNKDFYEYVVCQDPCKDFDIQNLVDNNHIKIQRTQPINFKISKNMRYDRIISLPHPLAQLYIVAFIKSYGDLLLNYFKQNSVFSIRYPYKRASILKKDIDAIQKYVEKYVDVNMELTDEDIIEYIDSYYLKASYKRINEFYNSKLLKHFEQKYKLMLKMDYQDCFYRIYTHSIDWAYLGDKEIAKENTNHKSRFSSILDSIVQNMNYGETAGIIVGPEFCRWVAEIVLCRIDRLVYDKLKMKNFVFKRDYSIVRFVDDIFVFSNDKNILEEISKYYHQYCTEFKLAINDQKTYIEDKPFIRVRYWVEKIKEIYKYYEVSLSKISDYTFEGIFQSQSDRIVSKIKGLIVDYEENTNSIISYFLSSFQNQQNKTKHEILDYTESVKKYYYLQQLDILYSIIPYALTASNVLKYIRCVKWILNNAESDGINVTNEIFEQFLNLIRYNIPKSNEIYNLLLFLSSFKKDVPEYILLDILQDQHSFSIISVAFYIKANNRKFKYSQVRQKISDYIAEKISLLLEKPKQIDVISSPDFLLVHDIYSSGVLDRGTMQLAEKLKLKIQAIPLTDDPMLNVFIKYVRGFDHSFVRWDMKDVDIFGGVIKKTMANKIGDSISS